MHRGEVSPLVAVNALPVQTCTVIAIHNPQPTNGREKTMAPYGELFSELSNKKFIVIGNNKHTSATNKVFRVKLIDQATTCLQMKTHIITAANALERHVINILMRSLTLGPMLSVITIPMRNMLIMTGILPIEATMRLATGDSKLICVLISCLDSDIFHFSQPHHTQIDNQTHNPTLISC